uniref:Uncharacterized protein n=1 Tax=Knipowitschia caucasica TaxID=637954 RepID=A0AAV2JBL1_KNICA
MIIRIPSGTPPATRVPPLFSVFRILPLLLTPERSESSFHKRSLRAGGGGGGGGAPTYSTNTLHPRGEAQASRLRCPSVPPRFPQPHTSRS